MREYVTTNIIDICCGRVGLGDAQAAARAGSLKKIANGVYDVLTPIQLKAGEVVAFDPDKVTLAKVELTQNGMAQEAKEKEAAIEAEVQKRLAEEKAKAEAEAKAKKDAEEKAKAEAEAKAKANKKP